MSSSTTTPKDNWANGAYLENARFVPRSATILINDFLKPSSQDHILDIGCGDGELTANIPCAYIAGTDGSAALIETAQKRTGPDGKPLVAIVEDARDFTAAKSIKELSNGGQKFDKVVSNAALHWILYTRDRELEFMRSKKAGKSSGSFDPHEEFDEGLEKQAAELGDSIRQRFFDNVYEVLKSGSNAVFAVEMGGLGNIAEFCSACTAILERHGLPAAQVRNFGVHPWYFPHEDTIRKYLEKSGFVVERIERAYKSTPLPHGKLGLQKWAETFGFSYVETFEKLQKIKQEEAAAKGIPFEIVSNDKFLEEVCDQLKFSCFDPEDRTKSQAYSGYVRLRWRAIKK